MIIPTKHIKLSESLLGFGGALLGLLKKPQSIDELWHTYSEANKKFKILPAYHNFENLVLALDYLFIIGAIKIDSEERIYHAFN